MQNQVALSVDSSSESDQTDDELTHVSSDEFVSLNALNDDDDEESITFSESTLHGGHEMTPALPICLSDASFLSAKSQLSLAASSSFVELQTDDFTDSEGSTVGLKLLAPVQEDDIPVAVGPMINKFELISNGIQVEVQETKKGKKSEDPSDVDAEKQTEIGTENLMTKLRSPDPIDEPMKESVQISTHPVTQEETASRNDQSDDVDMKTNESDLTHTRESHAIESHAIDDPVSSPLEVIPSSLDAGLCSTTTVMAVNAEGNESTPPPSVESPTQRRKRIRMMMINAYTGNTVTPEVEELKANQAKIDAEESPKVTPRSSEVAETTIMTDTENDTIEPPKEKES